MGKNNMMATLQHFFAMGGYGFFVWSAYGFAFLVLFFNMFVSIKRWKQIKKIIKS